MKKGRRSSSLAVLGCLLCLVTGSGAEAWQAPLSADETPAMARSGQAFDAADVPVAEDIPGAGLLLIAYGLMWLLVLAYVLRLAHLQSRAQGELKRLEKVLAQTQTPDSPENAG